MEALLLCPCMLLPPLPARCMSAVLPVLLLPYLLPLPVMLLCLLTTSPGCMPTSTQLLLTTRFRVTSFPDIRQLYPATQLLPRLLPDTDPWLSQMPPDSSTRTLNPTDP